MQGATTVSELTERLPGIEVETALPEPQPGHWIERAPGKRLMVFSGRSHPELAQRIAEQLGVELGEIELETFANGETYCRYGESIRGADVFLVQTGCEPVDRNLMELLFMIQAAKLASAKRITAVIPWFAYSRQDRKARPREPISARLVADMLQLAGADRVLTMDLHAGQIQGFFSIPVDHMTALPLFVQHFHDLGLTGPEVVSVAPDAGRAKYAHRFSELISADFAIMHKTRPAHDVAEVTEITGSVEGKIAVVGDDMTTTGGTLIAGAETLKEYGAREVWMFVTHLLVQDEALERLGDAGITGLVVTDTVPIDPVRKPDNVTVLTVSRLLAETIMNVFADESVSAIFGPETSSSASLAGHCSRRAQPGSAEASRARGRMLRERGLSVLKCTVLRRARLSSFASDEPGTLEGSRYTFRPWLPSESNSRSRNASRSARANRAAFGAKAWYPASSTGAGSRRTRSACRSETSGVH